MTTPVFGILMLLATVALAFGLALSAMADLLRGQRPLPTRTAKAALHDSMTWERGMKEIR